MTNFSRVSYVIRSIVDLVINGWKHVISASYCSSNPGFSTCSFMAFDKVRNNFSCIKVARLVACG